MSVPYVRSLFGAWRLILLTTVLGAVLALVFSFLTPLQFSSTERLLITQPNSGNLDPYTALKATERIASSLSELVYTTSFFNNVMTSAKTFDATYFPLDEIKKRDLWRKAIETSITPGTGIMTITAYHPDRQQARLLVGASATQLSALANAYFGENVRVQVIDSPLDSRWYARPHFLNNALFGLFVGFLIGIAWVLARVTKKMG